MDYLHSKGITDCIRPLKSRKGQFESTVEITGKELLDYDTQNKQSNTQEVRKMKFFMRIVTYIPGECLDHVHKQYLTPQLLYNVGNFIGKVDAVLSVS